MSEQQQQQDRPMPFEITHIDRSKRVIVLEVRDDVSGSVANQLKVTPDERRAGRVCRRLGHMLSSAANVLYGRDPSEFPELGGTTLVSDAGVEEELPKVAKQDA